MKRKKNAGRRAAREERAYDNARRTAASPGFLLWKALRVLLIYLAAFLLLAGAALSGWSRISAYFFSPMDSQDTASVDFTVEAGSSLSSVARRLQSAGLIRSGTVFRYYADFAGMGQRIQSGRYAFSKSQSAHEILQGLVSGSALPSTLRVTVIPGWTVEDTAAYMKGLGLFSDETRFLSLCRNPDVFRDIFFVQSLPSSENGGVKYALEGYLSPNTYEVYTASGEEALIRKLLLQTESTYISAFEDRAQGFGFSFTDVFTLASIIEKEAKREDFAKVSAIFHNRLAKKMSLDSDATIKYASGSRKMALGSEDLAVDSPYNTYKRKGLPAGPICNPSGDAISAALYPDETFVSEGYLYFCSTDPNSGALHFSKTLKEHEAAVAMYRPLWEAFDRERGLTE